MKYEVGDFEGAKVGDFSLGTQIFGKNPSKI